MYMFIFIPKILFCILIIERPSNYIERIFFTFSIQICFKYNCVSETLIRIWADTAF